MNTSVRTLVRIVLLTCQPATGRVLAVNSDQLQVSIGRANGIQPGDELTLYKTNEVADWRPRQESNLQLNLRRVSLYPFNYRD